MPDFKDSCRPAGFFLHTKDWIQSQASRSGVELRTIYPRTIFPVHLKRNPKPEEDNSNWSEEGYVSVIPEGRVWGKNGAVITPDQQLLWDASIEWFASPEEHPVFKQKQAPPISYFPGTLANLSYIGSKNYYHWMYEVLPRIDLIRKSGLPVDKYVVSHDALPFQLETLRYMGIRDEHMLFSHNNLHLQARVLVVPSIPTFALRWATRFIRKEFLPADSPTSGKKRLRIYIRREKFRKVLNERSVVNLLQAYGFKEVLPEAMSVKEQIKLFSSAEAVVAPHGAGLANLAFCNPQTKVIELIPSTYVNVLYCVISHFSGLDYYFLMCKGTANPKHHSSVRNFDNLEVNLKQLASLLTEAGL